MHFLQCCEWYHFPIDFELNGVSISNIKIEMLMKSNVRPN